MRQTPPEDEKWAKYLDALVQETDTQTQLGEDILQISSIYTGRLEMNPRPMSLDELTRVVFTRHQALAQERGVTLEHRPAQKGEKDWIVSVDPRQMLSWSVSVFSHIRM